MTSGNRVDLEWFKRELAKRFDIKSEMIGEDQDLKKELNVLNRIVRVTEDGFEMEADIRHVELMVEELGLGNSKAVMTPGEDEEDGDEKEEDEDLPVNPNDDNEEYVEEDKEVIDKPMNEIGNFQSNPL